MLKAGLYGLIVILNVSSYRCDALIITQSGIRLLELPHLSEDAINDHVGDLLSLETLEWLWDVIIRPVLDDLGFTEPPPGKRFLIFFRHLEEIDLTSFRTRQIHGHHFLPPGYKLAMLPSNAEVEPVTNRNEIIISSTNNLPKAIITVVQGFYAIYTIIKTVGGDHDQIRLFGFAAFGFTPLPYLVMSVVNLIGNIATAGYPTLYLVGSDVLDEVNDISYQDLTTGILYGPGGARYFDGTVGRLQYSRNTSPRVRVQSVSANWRESITTFEAVSILVWLFCGIIIGSVLALFRKRIETRYPGAPASVQNRLLFLFIFYVIVYTAPTICGTIAVTFMMGKYGHCITLSQ